MTPLRVLIVQAKRTLLLDGVVNILTAYTDYGQLVPPPSTTDGIFDQQDRSSASLDLLMSILPAIPLDLVKHRYLPQLATWVEDWPLQDGCTLGVKNAEECAVWLQVFRRLLEAYLRGRTGQLVGAGGKGAGEKLTWSNAEGRKLGLLGLVLSQGFAALADRDQVCRVFCYRRRRFKTEDVAKPRWLQSTSQNMDHGREVENARSFVHQR